MIVTRGEGIPGRIDASGIFGGVMLALIRAYEVGYDMFPRPRSDRACLTHVYKFFSVVNPSPVVYIILILPLSLPFLS